MFTHIDSFSRNPHRGSMLVVTLVFASIFVTILVAFIAYVTTQSQVVTQRYHLDRSIEIAESGLNYFKWYLHHHTDDIAAALPTGGATTSVYYDVAGNPIGEYTLNVATTTYCGSIASIEVVSTGRTYDEPGLTRTVSGRFMRPTVANYSYILDAPFVWAGEDREIWGPYHSNGQIRMDGYNRSTVSSEVNTQDGNDGVYTTTSHASTTLFIFPVMEIPFGNFVNDLDEIEAAATSSGGYYQGPSSHYGYLVEFIGGGQMRVTDVTNTYSYDGYTSETDWQTERNIIRSLGGSTVWNINPDCPVAFFEDKIWLRAVDDADADTDDELDEMITVVSTDTVILQGDIEYEDPEEDGLLVIAENDVLVGVDVPNNMTLNGIFVAQQGRFGRNHYTDTSLPSSCGWQWMPGWSWICYDYSGYYRRSLLSINGTIVSKGRVGTQWNSGGGSFLSGFENRTNTYNRDLVDNPPPLVPHTESNYNLVDWQEVE